MTVSHRVSVPSSPATPPTDPEFEGEVRRILNENQRRERVLDPGFYSLDRLSNLFIRQGQERALVELLTRADYVPLRDSRVLEVGFGVGHWLATFERLGVAAKQLAGTEIDSSRLQRVVERFPAADLRVVAGAALPWPDQSFDFVVQSTVFTSILDEHLRRELAREMLRVLKTAGAVVWCDFMFDNPMNSNVRGIPIRELRQLFPACGVRWKRVTLAPPIARRLAPRAWLVADLLERLRLLNTHCLALIQKHP
jgi:ubiquinone/menaquinone biosynthesis C-methylase UbiE